MSKFKVVARVTIKASADQSYGWTHGNEYEVTRVYKDEYGNDRIKTNIDDHGSTTNGWLAEYFEPIEAVPVRTVTRKEIVPGTYGRLYVEPSTSPKKVNVNFNDEDGKIFSMGLNCHLDSSELREAAHILNQIAEALEDD